MLYLKLPALKLACLLSVFLVVAGVCHPQERSVSSPLELLDHLAGNWILQGMIGGKQTTHDVQVSWMLKHEYLSIHEVSREKDAKGDPAYEAIVYIGWNTKTGEYACLWLDATSGNGLSAKGIAHGKQTGDSIPFVFTLSSSSAIRNTFVYNRAADTWKWLIDDESNGKSERFADVTLSRAR